MEFYNLISWCFEGEASLEELLELHNSLSNEEKTASKYIILVSNFLNDREISDDDRQFMSRLETTMGVTSQIDDFRRMFMGMVFTYYNRDVLFEWDSIPQLAMGVRKLQSGESL